MQLIDKERVRKEMLSFIKKKPMSIKFFGDEIGMNGNTFKLFLTKGVSDYKTVLMIQNYLESKGIVFPANE